jgi:hypothetical protein
MIFRLAKEVFSLVKRFLELFEIQHFMEQAV